MWFIETIEMHPVLFYLLLSLLGLAVGSFLNVVIYRLPFLFLETSSELPLPYEKTLHHFSLAYPASYCPHCKKSLSWWHNIPLISFIFLKGRCGMCQQLISWRYLFVELLSLFVTVFSGIEFGVSSACLAACVFGWFLIAISFIDIKHQWVPDVLSITLLWVGLFLSCFELFTDSNDAILGAVIAYLFLWFVGTLYQLIRRRSGIGLGDFKLLAAAGAWLGWQLLPFVILVSSLLGLMAGTIYLIIRRQPRYTPIPFAPFIAIAAWIALIWGYDITQYYLNFIGLGWTNV